MDPDQMSPKCALKVILEPPSAIQPGKVLFPPLILSIQLEEGVREKTQPASDRLPDVGQLWRAEPGHVALDQAFEGLWAIIHLVPQGTNGTLGKASMATHPMALSGKLADTPHRAVSQPLEAGLRYLKFEDLAIHEIGTFSLRISLCRMSYVQGGAGAGPEAATIGCVSTRSILVHPCAACEPIGPEVIERLAYFKELGILSRNSYAETAQPPGLRRRKHADSDGHSGSSQCNPTTNAAGRSSPH